MSLPVTPSNYLGCLCVNHVKMHSAQIKIPADICTRYPARLLISIIVISICDNKSVEMRLRVSEQSLKKRKYQMM